MKEDWKFVKFSSLGEVNRGRSRHRPRDDKQLYGGVYPFIQTGDIKASNGRVTSYSQTYSEKGLSQSRMWPKNTLVITIAANIAETAILSFPACFPDSVVGFIPDDTKCNVFFIEYYFRYLKSNIQREFVGSGSVQDNINLQFLNGLELRIPNIQTQNSIASILGSLDDKIDLNRRTNETLEAMAQALFRDWFVDFGPTRAKMAGEAPYLAPELWELFPDRLDNEGKPEGWHQKPISEHFSVSIGKTPPRKEREHFVSSGHGVPWLSIRDMGIGNVFVSTTSENLTPESVERFNIKIASEGTVLLSFKLTVGRVMITNQQISTNEAIAHLFSKTVPTNYTYCYLKNFDFDTLGSTSSIATAVNSKTIRDMPFLIPSNSILNEFRAC